MAVQPVRYFGEAGPDGLGVDAFGEEEHLDVHVTFPEVIAERGFDDDEVGIADEVFDLDGGGIAIDGDEMNDAAF